MKIMTDTFHMEFVFRPRMSSKLLSGILYLFQNGEQINEIVAVSSRRNKQFWGSWNSSGGLIPPGDWTVKTEPLKNLSTPGVKTGDSNSPSWFYEIAPFTREMSNGVIRGDFGVHFDGNAPGSLGCVCPRSLLGWQRVREFMAAANAVGLAVVPIKIRYLQEAA